MPPNSGWFHIKKASRRSACCRNSLYLLGESPAGTDTGMAFGVLAISSRFSVRLAGGQFAANSLAYPHAVVPNMIGLLIQHVYQFRFFPDGDNVMALSRGMKYISPDFHSLPSLSASQIHRKT